MMRTNEKRPGALRELRGAKIEAADTASMPALAPAVNRESPKLWRAFRRFARNHRRIARLMAENEVLLARMKHVQGVRA